MSDKFSIEKEKLIRLEKILRSDISKRTELERKNQSTSIIEAGIRGQFDEIYRIIKNLTNNEIQSAKGLPQNEINRRLSLVQGITNSIDKMKSDYEFSMSKALVEKNKQNLSLNTENEQSDRDLIDKISSGEMMKLQQDKIKKQDEMLEEFHGLLVSTKRHNQEMENEIKIQTPMLKNLESQMDSTDNRMKRAQKKLNQYFEKSSNSCLMTAICIEVVLMLVIILAL